LLAVVAVAGGRGGTPTDHHPGDSMPVAWMDVSGQQHTATVRLASGPPN
jgi:hypothetical protein